MKAKWLFPFLLLLTLARGWWVATSQVSPQEAYYWMCAGRMAPGFFDGPAGTALLVHAFGDGLEFARLFWPVMGFLAGWAGWMFLRRVYDEDVAGWAVLLLNFLPVFNRASTQVGPLMPALALTLTGLVLVKVAWDGRRPAWLGAGVMFATALLFRYEVVLILLGVVAAVGASRRHRRDFVWVAVVLLLGAAALWPSMAWNASLEWIPILRGTWRSALEFNVDRMAGSFGAFVIAFSIPVAMLLAAGLVILIRSARFHARAGFVAVLCLPAWLWCAVLLYTGGDAITPAWLGFLPLAGFVMAGAWKRPATRVAVQVVIVLAAVFSVFGLKKEDWKSFSGEMALAARELPAADQSGFFIAEDPELAAILGYHLPHHPGPPPVFVPESPAVSSQFGIWPSYADFVEGGGPANEYFTEQKGVNPYIGRHAVYVGHELPQTISAAFTEVVPVKTIVAPDGRALGIYLCLGYETLPL